MKKYIYIGFFNESNEIVGTMSFEVKEHSDEIIEKALINIEEERKNGVYDFIYIDKITKVESISKEVYQKNQCLN